MPVKTAVVAIGGNSLITGKEKRDVKYQWDAVRETCGHIANMIREGWRVANHSRQRPTSRLHSAP